MKARACPREEELFDALFRGFVEPELAAHAEECSSCGELRLIAGSLMEERIEAIRDAPVPSAGAMWLRVQMRQHHEAQARARRSLLIGQAATLIIALALVVSLFGVDLAIAAGNIVAAIRVSTPLLLALATIIAAPIAGYVAILRR